MVTGTIKGETENATRQMAACSAAAFWPVESNPACQMGENEESKRISGECYIHFMYSPSQAVLAEQQLEKASIKEIFQGPCIMTCVKRWSKQLKACEGGG